MYSKDFVFFMVKKYFRFDKTQPFISITAILSFLGVAVGIMVLIIAMAIMNGTAKEFKSRLFTMNYPITVLSTNSKAIDSQILNRLENRFPDLKFSPYIDAQAVVQDGSNLLPISIYGVDFKREESVNSVLKDALNGDFNQKKYRLIIGKTLKDELMLSSGDRVTLMFSKVDSYGFSNMPKLKRFYISNSFSSGLNSYDNSMAYTTLESLQKVLNIKPDTYSGIHIYSDIPFEDIKEIEKFLGKDLRVVGWWQQNGSFFSALEMEKRALFIVLMLIILVASLNIISSLLMTIMNRRKEIALLITMGASKREIQNIFLYLGIVIGGSGLIFGILLGFLGIYLLGNYDIVSLPADVYGSSKLPLDLDNLDLLYTAIGGSLLIIISSYYPSKKVTTIDPVTTLKNE